ncbi:hypothetical protein B0H13DRAFT_1915636 [Mycena leptocephala]|nr:hypothetical protein B0H13DRAFT_1915636 [Mycena leptocephala]
MGLHRMGRQRPNGLAQKGVAEAKWACTEGGGRGQMGVHRMERQRPNGHAQDGVAEAKWACTGWGGRGQMGVHRMGWQRPNGLAQNGTEITPFSGPAAGFGHIGPVVWKGSIFGAWGNTQCSKKFIVEKNGLSKSRVALMEARCKLNGGG